MLYDYSRAISLMDEIKVQAQVLIPVLQSARAELGEERANCLIFDALRAWSRERIKRAGAGFPGSPYQKWDALNNMWTSLRREGDLEYALLKRDSQAFEIDIHRCRYAELFRELGEPDLGAVLLCEGDIQAVEEVGSPEVELTRTQTLMQGGCRCDYRFRFKSSSV